MYIYRITEYNTTYPSFAHQKRINELNGYDDDGTKTTKTTHSEDVGDEVYWLWLLCENQRRPLNSQPYNDDVGFSLERRPIDSETEDWSYVTDPERKPLVRDLPEGHNDLWKWYHEYDEKLRE